MPRPLKEIRTGRNIGVRRLSQGAPVSPRTIITTEKGESTPGVETIRKISRFLDVDPMEVTEFKAALEEQGLDVLPDEPAPIVSSEVSGGVPVSNERDFEHLVELMRDLGRVQTRAAYRKAFGEDL